MKYHFETPSGQGAKDTTTVSPRSDHSFQVVSRVVRISTRRCYVPPIPSHSTIAPDLGILEFLNFKTVIFRDMDHLRR